MNPATFKNQNQNAKRTSTTSTKELEEPSVKYKKATITAEDLVRNIELNFQPLKNQITKLQASKKYHKAKSEEKTQIIQELQARKNLYKNDVAEQKLKIENLEKKNNALMHEKMALQKAVQDQNKIIENLLQQ